MFSVSHLICGIVIINSCFGWFWDCPKRFYIHAGWLGSPDLSPDLEYCADEGGYCSGSGYVIYGNANQWAWVDTTNGVSCSNSAFGCDPVPLVKKRCYISKNRRFPVNRRRMFDGNNPYIYQCNFDVLNVNDNSGSQYFNFNALSVDEILGTKVETGYYRIFNYRTQNISKVYMDVSNYGNGYGINKYDNIWHKDDKLALLTPESKYLQCTEIENKEKCEMGNIDNDDGYFYIYNENRGTDSAECGKNADCGCCRALTPTFC